MISHIDLYVSDLKTSESFYLSALKPLDFKKADEGPGYVRITNGRDAVIVLSQVEPKHEHRPFHRKAVGIGHLALLADSAEQVDRLEAHLTSLGIELRGDGKTELNYRNGYYCLCFEDPDRILLEVVHHDEFYFSY